MKIRSKLFWLFVALAITYALINLIATPPRATLQHYHISSATLRLIDFSVVGPIIVIWFIGLFGFQKLHRYTAYIAGNKDGRHVAQLSRGVQFLVLWQPINSTVSVVLSLIGKHQPNLQSAISIVITYLGLVLPLAGFFYFSKGARGLSELVKQRPTWATMNFLASLLILIGMFYTYMVAKAHADLSAIYHLPVVLVLLTVVAPYIFSWYLGLFAAYELHQYTYKLKGVIYKRSWNHLAFGISWIIVFSMVLQFVTVVTAKFVNISLGGILALIYGVIAVLAIGYILIALGAHKLTKIEEV